MADHRDGRRGRRPHQQQQQQQGRSADPRSQYEPSARWEIQQLREQLESERQLKEIAQDKEKRAQRELDTLARNAPLDSIRFVKVAERVRKDLERERYPPRKADFEEVLSAVLFSKQELELEKAKRQGCEDQLARLTSAYDALKKRYDEETSSRQTETDKTQDRSGLEQVQQELQVEKTKRKKLEEQFSTFTSAVSELKKKYKQEKLGLSQELKTLQDQSRKETEELKEQVFKKETLLGHLQDQLDSERQLRSSVEQELQLLQLQHSGLQDQSAAALQQEQETVKSLQNQLEEVHKAQAQSMQDKEELKTRDQEKRLLKDRQELDEEKTKRKKLEEEFSSFTSAVSELKKKHNQEKLGLSQELESLQDKSKKETEELKELKEQVFKKKTLLEHLQDQLDSERQLRSDVEQELQLLQLQHSGLQDQSAAALQQEQETVKSLQDQLEEVHKTQAESSQEQEELGRQLVAANEQTELLKERYEELQRSSESSQEKMTSDLHEQRDRQEEVQAMLEKVSIFNEELTLLRHKEAAEAQKQAAKYERDLESRDREHRLLRDQQEALQSRLSEQQRQWEEMRAHISLIQDQQSDPKPGPGPESEETPKKKPSSWKRFRHFLGLRKPQRWKTGPTSTPEA